MAAPGGRPHICAAEAAPGEAGVAAGAASGWAATVGTRPRPPPPGPWSGWVGFKGPGPQAGEGPTALTGSPATEPRGPGVTSLASCAAGPCTLRPRQQDLPLLVHLPRPSTRWRSELCWGRGGGKGAGRDSPSRRKTARWGPAPPPRPCLLLAHSPLPQPPPHDTPRLRAKSHTGPVRGWLRRPWGPFIQGYSQVLGCRDTKGFRATLLLDSPKNPLREGDALQPILQTRKLSPKGTCQRQRGEASLSLTLPSQQQAPSSSQASLWPSS